MAKKFWKGSYFNQTEALQKAGSEAGHAGNVLQPLGQHRNSSFPLWQKHYCLQHNPVKAGC